MGRISRKDGFFIQGKAKFKETADFRVNALSTNKAEILFNEGREIKYAVKEGVILLDCDSQSAIDTIESMNKSLGIKTYSYQTKPGHRHYWFKVDQNVQTLVDIFKRNSSAHMLDIHPDIDTRSYRKEGRKALQGQVFLKNKDKESSERPSPQVLIDNIQDLPLCPIAYLMPKCDYWIKRTLFGLSWRTFVKSGDGRHNWEIKCMSAFKSLGLLPQVCYKYMQEMVLILKDNKGRPLFDYAGFYEVWEKAYEYSVKNDLSEFKTNTLGHFHPDDTEALNKINKIQVKELMKECQRLMGWVYYKSEYWMIHPLTGSYVNFSECHEKANIKTYFIKEIKERMQFDSKIKPFTINISTSPAAWTKGDNDYKALPSALKSMISNLWSNLKMLRAQVYDIADSVVCKNAWIQKIDGEIVVSKEMDKAPFTLNQIKRSYTPGLERPEMLNKFLLNLFRDEETIQKMLNLLSFSIANYNSGVILVITGEPFCGKGTLETILNKVIGEQNVASINGDDVFSNRSFALEGTVNKLFACMNEQGGEVSAKNGKSMKKMGDTNTHLSGVNQKFKKADRPKATCIYTIMSNEILCFDISDKALMSRMSLIDRSTDFDERVNLNPEEYEELMSENTYQYMFMEFFERQVKLFKKTNSRNANYKVDNDEYIKIIESQSRLLTALKNRIKQGNLSKDNYASIYIDTNAIPFLIVKNHMKYLGYNYNNKTEMFVFNDPWDLK